MADQVVGTVNGVTVYRDAYGCYYLYTDASGQVWEVPTNCPNINNNTPQLPSITGQGVSSGGALITSGHSWYEDLLNTILGVSAITNHAPYIPSTNQGSYYQTQASAQSNAAAQAAAQAAAMRGLPNSGATLGASLQDFIQKNLPLLVLGGGALLLYKSGRK